MSKKPKEADLSVWFSTYGLITAERILARFHIFLKQDDLVHAIRAPGTLYHNLLIVPLKNVFNGIIIGQAKDYRVYAQKLFIDYLMFDPASEDENAPAAGTHELLEFERVRLVELGNAFEQQEYVHKKFITESQYALIQFARILPKERSLITDAHIKELDQITIPLIERADAINVSMRTYRSDFYSLILKSTNLIELLPDYRPDLVKIIENRAALYFDSKIGDDEGGKK